MQMLMEYANKMFFNKYVFKNSSHMANNSNKVICKHIISVVHICGNMDFLSQVGAQKITMLIQDLHKANELHVVQVEILVYKLM